MLERIFIAGSGGQGIVLMGKILANSALTAVKHLTFYPSYGAEVRGGTSNCQVILSSDEIASPLSDDFDTVVIMNQESADAFKKKISHAPMLLLNSSLCRFSGENGELVEVPATATAETLGNARTANFVMLGAYVARKKVISPAFVEKALIQSFEKKGKAMLDLNLKAFRAGLET
jgi:2-oxoglutarate ferredoxin oxidoreductase subunit gamma